MRGAGLDRWEVAAVGLAVGVVAHASAWTAAALLLLGLAWLVDEDRVSLWARGALPAIAGVSLATVLWGAGGAIAAALIWRVAVEAQRASGGRPNIHAWTAPAAAIAWRLGAPDLLAAGLFCVALVAWVDWIVRALAAWRLDEAVDDAFLPAQAALLAPLLAFSDPTGCLVAYLAMGLARAITWAPRAPTATYAVAR